jgi:Ca-activated chloride channel family protein
MEIPQLSQKQFEIIMSAIEAFYDRSVNHITWVVADAMLDKEMYERRRAGQEAISLLVPMGLLEDITDTSKEYAQALMANSDGRSWRIFRLSDLAHHMFSPGEQHYSPLGGTMRALLLSLLLCVVSYAQTYKKDVKVVQVPVYVTDANTNVPFTLLTKDHFRIWDNRVEQKIKYFSQEAEPLSIGIVLDTSGSIGYKKDFAIKTVKEFMNQSTSQDEFFLVQFNQYISNTGFVDKEEDITSALPEFAEAKGQTSLIDAVYMATEYIKKHAKYERRALVLISDGGDNHSRYTEGELISFMREADVPVFVVGLFDAAPETLEEQSGPKLLERLADASGGQGYAVVDYKSLLDTMSYFGEILHNCYVLGYAPTEVKMNGKFHKLKVKLTRLPREVPPLRVQAKPGYYE